MLEADGRLCPPSAIQKPKRCRIKGVVRKVREVLEFLFSEPNLRRDSFLKQRVGPSGTNPISILILLQFNKINELTQDVQILRRAAYESKILRLCDLQNSGDQGGVSRRDPVPPPPRDILQKTVYLEGLPKDATIQWLNHLIVALTAHKPMHISLPRQKTGQSRGFAFIEFGSYNQASSTVKDFNSKKAIATAFLLQSSRRKLFQNSIRQRTLKILESTTSSSLILPPPCPRFMDRSKRDRMSSMKSANSTTKNFDQKSRKRGRESDSDYRERRRKDSSSKRREKKQTETSTVEAFHSSQKLVVTQPELVATVQAVDEVASSRPRNRKRQRSLGQKEAAPDNSTKKIRPENSRVAKTARFNLAQINLFRRARTNSYPPLSGCNIFHSGQYWTDRMSSTLNTGKNAEGLGSAQNMFVGSNEICQLIDKSTQTDYSYTQMLKKQWRDRTMEKRIEQLVKQGRNDSKKRKIPSTIHIPMNCKKKRKTRIRRKRRSQKFSKRKRRNSNIIIPNWGGLRLKAILASEWNQLKRKYKEIQKQNMRKLKQSLKDTTFLFAGAALRKHIKYDEFLANTSDHEDNDESSTEMENDFNQSEPKNKPITDPRGSRRVGQAPIFRPGVIVNISSDSDLPTPAALRNRFSDYGCVAYVDRTTHRHGFIRFNNQSGAQQSIEKEDYYTLSLLTGQREEQYWESLLNKREAKRSSERKKMRGVERLVKKAIKQKTKERKLHILFDNDFIKE